ncbi:diaminopimelate decarboxylase [Pelagicoccus albus]|uniref:Diaminopimelate decarboxylase n=1 Tax=Pelagicoccus albus TaxID=415222 RepID=A0A7X1B8K4_9BACT|nr:diaminopimelate decarboxylase [Pelagicoccus albus]MBC2607677.1 diaminopimelate decarboxylase [Pelagicoccus albus]
MSQENFISRDLAEQIHSKVGTPCYVYSEAVLRDSASKVLAFPNAFGLTARYAMKASPNSNILRFFASMGLHFDASSGYEVRRAIAAGIEPQRISLSTQELPDDFVSLVESGISVNVCSLSQLKRFGQELPGEKVGLRINPGLGSGGTQRTNVGGPASSFGIWHEDLDQVKKLVEQYELNVFRIHSHIGSGSDPDVWIKVVGMNLALVDQFKSVTHLNLGGGYKVGRVEGEKTTDLQVIGEKMKAEFKEFAAKTGRKIHLEVEPGTYLVANGCSILSRVQDETSTGEEGYKFLKLDTGMTDNTRPSMYGAQHPMWVVPADNSRRGKEDYIVVGHCCESGDILTPKAGDPEALSPRTLKKARLGDYFVIGGAGAYCASMASKNYNSFPESPEVLVREGGRVAVIRERQPIEQIWANEVAVL